MLLLAAPELAAKSLGMEVDGRLGNLAVIYLLCPEPALEQFCCHINRQHFIADVGYRMGSKNEFFF